MAKYAGPDRFLKLFYLSNEIYGMDVLEILNASLTYSRWWKYFRTFKAKIKEEDNLISEKKLVYDDLFTVYTLTGQVTHNVEQGPELS